MRAAAHARRTVGTVDGVVRLPAVPPSSGTTAESAITSRIRSTGTPSSSAAAQSILPNVVDSGQLSVANGRLYAVELTANQFVGPPIGGGIARITLAGSLARSAPAYAIAATVLLLLLGPFRPLPDPGP